MTDLVLPAAPTVPAAMRALDAMQLELSQAATYEQIDDVIRKAEALRVLFKGVEDVEHLAQLTVVLGKRRIGEELKKIPKAHKHQSSKLGKLTTRIKPTERHRMGKLAGISEKDIRETSAVLQANGKDATVSGLLQELAYQGKSQARADKLNGLAAKALPLGQFNVAVIDPPWRSKTWSDKGMGRAADNHYPTMSLDDIKALPVSRMMTKRAMIGLWITVPFIGILREVLDAWAFEYKSMLTWDKVTPGTGFWLKNQTEHLVIASRGGFPAPEPGSQISSLYREKRGVHSAKPEAILDWIDSLYPVSPKIELFRRGPAREGWKAWGNESEAA